MLSDLDVRAVLVGNFGMDDFHHAMRPEYNRIYSEGCIDREPGFEPNYFPGSIDHGGEPYYCPNGWRRFAVDVGMNGEEFEKAYDDWHVAYHGTDIQNAHKILSGGLRANHDLNFIQSHEAAVYISPSIEYSGHPRYAKLRNKNDKYFQMVLMLRVRPTLLFQKHYGTVGSSNPKNPRIDPNFSNEELEWVVKWPPGEMIGTTDGILVYGLMFRVTETNPKELAELDKNKWWVGEDGNTDYLNVTED